jgi:hypothetical protein
MSQPAAAPVVELWCQDCEGHYQDGTRCRAHPRGYGCIRNSHWRTPRRLSGPSDAAICRTIGHDVREEVREGLNDPAPRAVFLDRRR